MGYVRNILFIVMLSSNHTAITPSMTLAIFAILFGQMRAKPILERVQRYWSDYQKLLLRAQSALIYRNYSDQCILAGVFMLVGKFCFLQ